MPVQLVTVPKHEKVVPIGDLVLGRLDHLALEFDDLPAANADQVVVVVLGDLIPRGTLIEVPLGGEPRVTVK